MGAEINDLEHMMRTLASASKDANSVTVGDFAKAVQSLQAELRMLEAEVDRLGGAVGKAFGGQPRSEPDAADVDQAATSA